CSAYGKNCGIYTNVDNCGVTKSYTCGLCGTGQTCTSNVCVCVPETDAAFCSRLGANCGSVTAADNCGTSRTVACGPCSAGEVCASDTCCTPLTKAEACGVQNCGTADDGCGGTVSCGTCSGATPKCASPCLQCVGQGQTCP